MKKIILFIFILFLSLIGFKFFFKNTKVAKAFFIYSKSLGTVNSASIDSNLNTSPILIAHAGGAYKGNAYTNSMEAFDQSLLNGFTYFEADFVSTIDGHYVSAHNWKFITGKEERLSLDNFKKIRKSKFGSLLQMEELISWILKHHVYLITDSKEENIRLLSTMIAYSDAVKQYVIPQTYTFEETMLVKQMGFDRIIFTNYNAKYPLWMLNTIWKSGLVWAITIPASPSNLLLYKYIIPKNTRLFMHTLNDQSQVNALFTAGVNGFYTDRLKSR